MCPPSLTLSTLFVGLVPPSRPKKKDIRTLISLEEREVSNQPWINTSAPRLLSDKHLLLTHLYTYIYVAFSLFYILCDEQLIVAVALQYPKRCTHTGLICSPLAIFIQNIKEEKKSWDQVWRPLFPIFRLCHVWCAAELLFLKNPLRFSHWFPNSFTRGQ